MIRGGCVNACVYVITAGRSRCEVAEKRAAPLREPYGFSDFVIRVIRAMPIPNDATPKHMMMKQTVCNTLKSTMTEMLGSFATAIRTKSQYSAQTIPNTTDFIGLAPRSPINFVGHILRRYVCQRFVIEDQTVVATERTPLPNARNLQHDGIK
jgi:hypothetical protein